MTFKQKLELELELEDVSYDTSNWGRVLKALQEQQVGSGADVGTGDISGRQACHSLGHQEDWLSF